MMRVAMMLGAALTLAGCAATIEQAPRAAAASPAVTQSNPGATLSTAPADSLLFWSEERRSAAFRAMETLFPGLEVAPAATPRPLPRATRPLPQVVQAELRRFMTDTRAAGVMVLQDGRVVFEDYGLGFGAQERWTSFSVAKSLTSTLLGAAIRDGAIAGLDTPVTAVLPELADTAYAGVTVGQVAAMTSGVAWNEDYTSATSDVARFLAVTPVAGESQVVTYARTLTRAAPAGEKWNYNTLETGLLGLIVERATGKSLAAYAAEKIVQPAGFAGKLFWMQDLTGGNIGGCCLSLRLSDYARFGQWVLEGGQPSVPAGWFEQAGAARSDLGRGYGYGLQWWTYPEGFGAQGIFGQSITIVPEKRLVIAVVSNYPTATGKALTDARREMLRRVIAAAGS